MPVTLTKTIVTAGAGGTLVLKGSGLTGGAGSSVTLGSQGVTAAPSIAPITKTLPATFAQAGDSVAIAIPDGAMNGTLTVTASDNSVATCALRIAPQYVFAGEYGGDGVDVTTLPEGELDLVLQRSSALVDGAIGGTIRLLQVLEKHPYYEMTADGPPKLFPLRTRGRRVPIVSVEQLAFASTSEILTVFGTTDLYVNSTLGQIEILPYAAGRYALLAQLQTISYSASALELAYTAGYAARDYPDEVREATMIIATKRLKQRALAAMGMGDVQRFGKQLQLETKFTIPSDAKILLRRFAGRNLA
jgi:hypothetical protein